MRPRLRADHWTLLALSESLDRLRAKAKQKGIYKGRPPSIEAEKIRELREQGVGASEIARKLRIGRASVYCLLQRPGQSERSADPLHLAFTAQVRVELGEDAQHVSNSSARVLKGVRRRRFDSRMPARVAPFQGVIQPERIPSRSERRSRAQTSRRRVAISKSSDCAAQR